MRLLYTAFLLLLLVPPVAQAQEAPSGQETVTVTATVPLSPLWAEAISTTSHVLVVPEGAEPNSAFTATVTLRGLNDKVLPNHQVLLQFKQDDQTLATTRQATSSSGQTVFRVTTPPKAPYTLAFAMEEYGQSVPLRHISYQDTSNAALPSPIAAGGIGASLVVGMTARHAYQRRRMQTLPSPLANNGAHLPETSPQHSASLHPQSLHAPTIVFDSARPLHSYN